MSRKHKRVLWPSLALAILAISGIVFDLAMNKSAAATIEVPEPNPVQLRAAPEFKQRIRVFVHRNDIRPQIIHAWPGKAVVSVENVSQADVSLQIERLLPNLNLPVGAVNLTASVNRLPQELTLAVGEYVLYDASRPTIRGRLIVEPRK